MIFPADQSINQTTEAYSKELTSPLTSIESKEHKIQSLVSYNIT